MVELLKIERELIIRKCRIDFWTFCKTLHGYKESYKHLKIMCKVLQDFFEDKLKDENGNIYKKLMINMPPRHFKTRTMILFCAWALGKDNSQTIISTSYSDNLATEFSRYTRDEIQREKNLSYDIVYSDIFPDTKLKKGDASSSKWSLEGQHFTYLGAGFGASITGKGCKIGIIDDQLKNYEEANNEMLLDKKWEWYTGTFKSRFEEGVKEIIIMTRWTNKDICGRILDDNIESKQWYLLKMEARNNETNEMLCPDMLSQESYDEKRRLIPDDVFQANYHQNPIEKKGLLYQKFLEYDVLPTIISRKFCCIDVADEGNDYLVAICGIESQRKFYITDLVCTKEPQEISENLVVDMIIKNDIRMCKIEKNAGGRTFARNIQRLLNEKKYFKCIIIPFAQTDNKLSRILTNSVNVENQIFYPINWSYTYPEFSRLLKNFMRSRQNKNDDVPDCLTMVVEEMNRLEGYVSGLKASDFGA